MFVFLFYISVLLDELCLSESCVICLLLFDHIFLDSLPRKIALELLTLRPRISAYKNFYSVCNSLGKTNSEEKLSGGVVVTSCRDATAGIPALTTSRHAAELLTDDAQPAPPHKVLAVFPQTLDMFAIFLINISLVT
jgi:hypothetical protein